MTIVVLLFLAGIWGVVLYGWFRDRLADTRPADSIGSFRRQLSVLERTGPSTGLPVARRLGPTPSASFAPSGPGPTPFPARRPVARSTAAKRRRDILFGLLAVMAGSLLLSFAPGLGALRLLHVAADALCLAYIGLLIRQRNLRAERAMKLRFLPSAAGAGAGVGDSALLFRRTGN